MSVSITIEGLAEVQARLIALPPKLRNKIFKATDNAVARVAIKEIRKEVSGTLETLKKIVTPGRELKQKTLKGRKGAAARQAMMDLRKAIGKRALEKRRMRDQNKTYLVVGPRADFKVRHVLNSKREHAAATAVADRIERGTSRSAPNPFTRRVFDRSAGMFQQAMVAAGHEALAQVK